MFNFIFEILLVITLTCICLLFIFGCFMAVICTLEDWFDIRAIEWVKKHVFRMQGESK